ncbi:MAG: extracellular solute-binding protein [Synergistaceae bacterium]|nr:extracellular solute-binding protein [Synergistaceae bacterium]
MKSKTAKILSILMVITLLAACGAQPGARQDPAPASGGGAQANETSVVTAEPASGEIVTIEMWHNLDEALGMIAALNTLISQFEQENPEIRVEHLFLEWSALRDNIVTGAATGMLPDILRGDIAFVPQFQSLDVLVEMSAFPDYAETADKLLSAPNSTAKMGDKFFGITAGANTKILFYNKELLAEAQIDVPTTLDELWEASTKLSGGGKYGFVEAWTGVWNIGQYIWSNGGDVMAPDYSTAQGYINGPIAVETIEKLAELYQANILAGPSMDPGAVGDTDGLAAGIYAMVIDGPWRESISEAAGLNMGAAGLPRGKTGSVGVLGGENFMMFKTSDDAHQKAAWEFIKFMSGKDAQVAMAKVGSMPVNKEAIADPQAIEAMPLLPVFVEALQSARSRPVHPRWSEMEDIIATKVAEAIMGQKPVQQALDEAASEIDSLVG